MLKGSPATPTGGQTRPPVADIAASQVVARYARFVLPGRRSRDHLSSAEQPRQVAVGSGEVPDPVSAGDLGADSVSKVLLRSTSRSSRAGLLAAAGPHSRTTAHADERAQDPLRGLAPIFHDLVGPGLAASRWPSAA